MRDPTAHCVKISCLVERFEHWRRHYAFVSLLLSTVRLRGVVRGRLYGIHIGKLEHWRHTTTKVWYFLTIDYSFGYAIPLHLSLENSATQRLHQVGTNTGWMP